MIVGVVGLGLIGGSMAKTIKARTEHTVLGTDVRDDTMKAALLTGAADGELTEETIPDCDLLLVALRPDAALDYVRGHADRIKKNAILVDLCGVKQYVCQVLAPLAKEKGFRFVGGHPMAGREKSGFINATERLFLQASMILVPEADTDAQTRKELERFFLSLGFAQIQYATADEHDKMIAYTSQLAHVLSSAYVKTPAALTHCGFSAGSFRDMTRVATLDEDMWTELFLENVDHLLPEVEGLIARLLPYEQALRERDAEKLRELLREGREYKAETIAAAGRRELLMEKERRTVK